jgi:hypothetical protein
MSVWRRKAIGCLPELKGEFQDPDTTIYDVFRELLNTMVEAHRRRDENKLKNFYDFAEWCFRNKNQELCNAAAVSFYEHLGDQPETLNAMTSWVKKDIYFDIRGLLELRMNDPDLKNLDISYGLKTK